MNRQDYPKCPKCNSNVNVVRLITGFRCSYCWIKFLKEEGQQTLKI